MSAAEKSRLLQGYPLFKESIDAHLSLSASTTTEAAGAARRGAPAGDDTHRGISLASPRVCFIMQF
jgi:hypothetical protein